MLINLQRQKMIGVGLLVLLLGLIAILMMPQMAASVPLMAPAAGSIGLVCTEDAGNTFDMQATEGYISTPDGNSIYMWGFALNTAAYQMPGPILCVTEGDTVTINLTNNLDVATSMIFPGQSGVTATGGTPGMLTNEAAANGGTVTYSFVASQPGTYLYETGTNPQIQNNMGLFGAIVIRPSMGPNYAYNDATTEFSDEFILLMHEIDPLLHQAVERDEPYDVTTRHDRYWTINGRSMPDTLNDNFVVWQPSQPYSALVRAEAIDSTLNPNGLPILVRYANAGTVNHPFHPHGDSLTVIAQDGRLLGDAQIDAFAKTLASGQTYDLLFTWENVENWTPGPEGPIPVDVPGIDDLVFKDGVTFYSGDAHLGQQGTLPIDVTTYNECGELYFPWHSHALDEVQNFDEGFGGLMTLVRIDPPGGCP